jgi:hypothetical protein
MAPGNTAAWQAWQRQLSRRHRNLGPWRRLSAQAPLAWGLIELIERSAGGNGSLDLAETLDLVLRLAEIQAGSRRSPTGLDEQLACWLADSVGTHLSAGLLIEQLAWAHALPRLAARVSADCWWRCLEQLVVTAEQAAEAPRQVPLLPRQLSAVELPWTLACLFPELEACRRLAPDSGAVVLEGMDELMDATGVPRAAQLDWLRPVLACWTRCRALSIKQAPGWWDAEIQGRYQGLVQEALRLARPDGSQALSTRSEFQLPQGAELLRAAAAFGNKHDRLIAGLALNGSKRAQGRPAASVRLPAASGNSESAGVAVLRSGWSKRAAVLSVAYGGPVLGSELNVRGEVVWSGLSNPVVELDSRPLEADSDWEEVCWVSDDAADYLELQLLLTGGARIERHLLLAHEGQFLLLADAVFAEEPAAIDYRSSLPLAPTMSFAPQAEFHEGWLAGRRRLCRVLPLALSEWRSDRRAGTLAAPASADGGTVLELRQSARQARSLFAPLFIDCSAARLTRPATWRRLTVAESRLVQPADAAVGYRVQVGRQQWLIYRSLAERGNRTVLGHNLISEFLVARFDRQGKVEPLLEIE